MVEVLRARDLVQAGAVLGVGALVPPLLHSIGQRASLEACGVAALLSLAMAVVRGCRRYSIELTLLIVGGILAWLAAACHLLVRAVPGVADLDRTPAFLISLLAGCGAWLKLASVAIRECVMSGHTHGVEHLAPGPNRTLSATVLTAAAFLYARSR